ncbi:MAG: hypothetical protein LRY68_11240 [Sulfurospirillum sp.]|nr:hypothetical protein [Sulfurospirillum sp.]
MKRAELEEQIKAGTLIPFIGMGVFKQTQCEDGFQIPFDSDSMILALNGGRAMSPRLMYEYSRAAMSLEQRKGRAFFGVNDPSYLHSQTLSFARGVCVAQKPYASLCCGSEFG